MNLIWDKVMLFSLFMAIFASSCSTDVGPSVTILNNNQAGNKIVLIDTNSSLFPSFNRNVSDYVSRCTEGKPVVLSVSSPRGTLVSIAGSQHRDGDFEVSISRSAGQSFTISIEENNETFLHHVRCLPLDFQWWTVEKFGDTQSEFYQIMPRRDGPDPKPYPAIFDNNGVPIWWTKHAQGVYSAQLLPNGRFAYLTDDSLIQLGLDGTMVRHLNLGILFDAHDSVLLPNGNLVIVNNQLLSGVDLTQWGLGHNESIVNHVIIEIDPLDNVVWSWNTYENIPISETDDPWQKYATPSQHYDPYHFNSIAKTPSGFLVSFRNLNAVFHIERNTGAILWKLGGTPRAESLTILNDPSPGKTICGQHDASFLDDGTVTLHENGSHQGRVPRALRYQIDLENRTATVVENIFSIFIPPSTCCGSARKLPGGNWVVAWGKSHSMMELASDGSRLFTLSFGAGDYFYRSLPVPYGQLDREALRAGMDAQHPIQ